MKYAPPHLLRSLHTPPVRRNSGVTLIVVLLILVVVSILGVSGIQISMMGERGTRNDRDQQVAWQAAEAALVDAEFDIEGLPARGQVRIHQCVPKPARPFQPMDLEVFAQKGGDDHPHPVMHPAGRPELPHPGVDNRVTGLPFLPGPQKSLVANPRKILELFSKRTIGGFREVKQQMMGEFAPGHLLQKS